MLHLQDLDVNWDIWRFTREDGTIAYLTYPSHYRGSGRPGAQRLTPYRFQATLELQNSFYKHFEFKCNETNEIFDMYPSDFRDFVLALQNGTIAFKDNSITANFKFVRKGATLGIALDI